MAGHPLNKSLPRRILNRLLNLFARISPGATTLRPQLHRLRGVIVGRDVFIGDDVFFDGEYPEMIEIQDGVGISMRAMIIAHNKGPGRVVIEKNAFVGPQAIVLGSGGKVLRIGEGAVVGAGCVISRNVPPRAVVVAAPTEVVGYAYKPFPSAETVEEFWSGLRPVPRRRTGTPHDTSRPSASSPT